MLVSCLSSGVNKVRRGTCDFHRETRPRDFKSLFWGEMQCVNSSFIKGGFLVLTDRNLVLIGKNRPMVRSYRIITEGVNEV